MKAIVVVVLLLGLIGLPHPANSTSVVSLPTASPTASASANDNEAAIAVTATQAADSAIAARLHAIYRELDGLAPTRVDVKAGVVTLSGQVEDPANIDRARDIALRVDGVVAVQNNLQRYGDIAQNLAPLIRRLTERFWQFINMLPLFFIALVITGLFWFAGAQLARAQSLWQRLSPNNFIADLLATSVRVILTLVGIVIALDLLGATTLMGAILGSAGVIGLAIGFAVKDTVDNYVSSIMLSIRQPFRANDHVVIGDSEGRVIRLTSRATILMTLEGNHLRIPNNTVFKAEILNYTRNPERRFDFVLGVDADDDPAEAIKVGVDRLRALPFVLREPSPGARLEEVGDSSIILRFVGWIDQTHSDWFKARSTAIRAVKIAIEEHGFGLPEPTYRLRFDGRSPLKVARDDTSDPTATTAPKDALPSTQALSQAIEDVSVENDIEAKVDQERQEGHAEDMLDTRRPVE